MLSELFKTEERIKILSHILYQDSFTVNEVSRETGVTKGLVSRYLSRLAEFGLLSRSGKAYSPKDTATIRAIKILLNLQKIGVEPLDYKWAKGIGIYGSWAKGTNTQDSDFDLWVKVDGYPSKQDLARLHKDLRSKINTEINMLVLTPEKIEALKKTDQPFYNSLVRTSMLLRGEPIEPYQ